MPSVYPVLPCGERPAVVYGLVDPRFGRVRYVGHTMNPSWRQKSHHFPAALAENNNNARWLRGLVARGLRARLVILQECAHKDAGELEKQFIRAYRARGYKLTNSTDGGEGMWGCSPSPETRALISARKKGIFKQTEAARAKIGAAHRGNPLALEHRAAIAVGCTGKVQTAETRAKKSAANKGTKPAQSTRDAVSRAKKGVALPPEVCQKMSAAHQGKPLSPEHRAAISRGHQKRKEKLNAARGEGARLSGGAGHAPAARSG